MPSKEVMPKFKRGKLHSGSKKGPIVTNPAQARAIAASEHREEEKHGGHYPEKSRRSKLREKRAREKRLEGAKL